MKKILLANFLFFLIAIPVLAGAAGLVPCDGANCTISSFFTMLGNIYNFLVVDIAAPLAGLSFAVGGVILLVSAGNPKLAGLGKQILWSATIGLVLVFCSWLIINSILTALGYKGNWSTL